MKNVTEELRIVTVLLEHALKKTKLVIKMGLAIAIPKRTYARIAPLFRLAIKRSIDAGASVVDANYCGKVGIVLINNSDDKLRVH